MPCFQEICATPQLFPDNPREGQVKQGLLGDCWFLCACAALQKSQHLLDQVRATLGFSPLGSFCLHRTGSSSKSRACAAWVEGRLGYQDSGPSVSCPPDWNHPHIRDMKTGQADRWNRVNRSICVCGLEFVFFTGLISLFSHM